MSSFVQPIVQGASVGLASLWRALLEGNLRVASWSNSETSFQVEFETTLNAATSRLSERDRDILVRLLRGQCPKAIAAELGCSLSTISANTKQSLRRMGLGVAPRHLPPFLVVLAHAKEGDVIAHMMSHTIAGGRYQLLVPWPAPTVDQRLSGGELDVLRLLLRGDSHAVIAQSRMSSPRTVANQLASLYSKLHVSGRHQLICRMFGTMLGETKASFDPAEFRQT